MDRDPKYFLIGLVIIVLFVGLTLFIAWANGSNHSAEKISYSIYLKNQSPAGLQKEGIVTMKGLKVGNIQHISFHPKDVEIVVVKISVDKDAPIKTDTTAIVQMNYVTGLASIDLANSSNQAPLLRNSDQKLLLIPEGKTKLEELRNTVPEILERTSKLLHQSERFLSESNASDVKKILENTAKLSDALASKTGDLETTISSFRTASNNLSKLTEELKTAVNSLTKQANSITQNSQQLITKATSQFEQSSKAIIGTAQSIKQGKESLLGPTEKNLLEN